MKLITTIALLVAVVQMCPAQNIQADRAQTLRQFVSDLKNEKQTDDIFKTYLESRGVFDTENTGRTAIEWTHFLEESVKTTDVGKIEIYKYTDRPETGRILKYASDSADGLPKHAPLIFELHGPNEKVSSVQVENLYVIRVNDQRVFVLFNHEQKMITWFALTWGHKVELVRF